VNAACGISVPSLPLSCMHSESSHQTDHASPYAQPQLSDLSSGTQIYSAMHLSHSLRNWDIGFLKEHARLFRLSSHDPVLQSIGQSKPPTASQITFYCMQIYYRHNIHFRNVMFFSLCYEKLLVRISEIILGLIFLGLMKWRRLALTIPIFPEAA